MLFANNERVKLDGDSKYAKDFKKKAKELEEIGFPIILRILPSWVSGTQDMTGKWVPFIPPQFIDYSAIEYSEDEGTIEWRYSPTAPRKRADGTLIFNSRGTRFFENHRRTEKFYKKDIDFLYFVIYKSGYNGSIFEVVDERREAREQVKAERQKTRLDEALFGSSSPFNNNSELLRTIAMSWGLNVEGRSDDALLISLKNSVLNSERLKNQGKYGMRGVDGFLQDINLGDTTKIRALIHEAINKNVIAFDDNPHNYGWFFLDDVGQLKDKIVGLSPKSEDIKEQRLAEYLMKNPSIADTIKQGCGYEVKDDFDPSKIREYTKKELTEQGKKIGINVVGRKKEDVCRDFEEYYGVK